MTFKKGDIVMLKTNGQKMTVTRIAGGSSDIFVILLTAGYVETEWSYKGEKRKGTFRVESLTGTEE
ncbi:DUF2158 domain-containing protein [Salmonella enterica]|nr:DUF2158 domain-containing protein [Salmonella enterica subsp. enterica serovar Hvittingfoss]EDI0467559.1 hypothetical protein [Salmonella enterica subsp. enterica serovar Newport]EGF6523939.1 DUF2158 domain-containing protein [Salmonella enterica]EHL2774333.1 DUF2158 domain-containing protein [Salmonella enterica subsp. enterica serovar Hvittingfoss]EHL2852481.1 DUF2158 domain-containing protein [Salmonella enterica subsp. enterica serovar Hvittingfoss]